MHRRDFVAGLIAAGALTRSDVLAPASAQTAGEPIDVVKKFGFVPDGRTDNYAAFHEWAKFVMRAKGGHYVFPPGTYYVARFVGDEGHQEDPVTGSGIIDCDGLTITGYGAKIRLNGKFHRSARPGRDGTPVGTTMRIFMPFDIAGCRNLTIAGFEIDGGLQDMSRDRSVGEIYAFLIALHGCTNVLLRDLDLHHCQTDAILLGHNTRRNPGTVCRNVRIEKVKCHHNARGGLAVIQVLGLACVDSAFNENGSPSTRYPPHAPGFGVDVEPDYIDPKVVESLTGDLEFRRCEFANNITAFAATYPERYRGYLRLIDCTSANARNGLYHIMISWPGALVEGGRHDCGEGTFWTSWQGAAGGDLTVRNCEVYASGSYGIFHAFDGHRVTLDRVKLTGTYREAGEQGFVLGIRNNPGGGRKNLVSNCEVFVPAARKWRGQPYDYEVSLYHTISRNNLFRTNLPATGKQHFCTEYAHQSEAHGDRYRGTAPGTEDSFRPGHFANHDTRSPFSRIFP